MNHRDLTAPELVKRFRALTGGSVIMGRDAHLLKDLLMKASSVQIELGLYNYENQPTMTIPLFVRLVDEWLQYDDYESEIELATLLSHTTPPEYFTWKELKDENGCEAFMAALEARLKLANWADRVLA